ncbi:MAG: nucleotide exchange factor GrpE [Acidobacteriota bacterium]
MTERKSDKHEQPQEDIPEEPKIRVTDRRFWAQDESLVDRTSLPDRKFPTIVEELKARTELAEQKLKEKLEQIAEENDAYRMRLRKELERQLDQEKLDLFRNFLEIIDNLERALKAADETATPEDLKEGVKLNLELLLSKLKTIGIEPIEVLHRPFDPHEAEALGTVSVDDPGLDQHVTEVLQGGFRWGDQILRPARVRIGQYQEGTPLENESQEATVSSKSP